MKRQLLLIFVLCFLSTGSLFSTVLIQIKKGSFANELGSPSAGMNYAIVVDTAGDGFDFSLSIGYDPFDIFSDNNSFLGIGGSGSDDFYTFGDSQQQSEGTGPPPDFEPGYINQVGNVDLSGPINTGQNFGVIWFPDNDALSGSPYGFVTNPGLLIDSDGSTVNYSSFIPDGIKAADFSVIHEPRTYALILGGLVGLGLVVARKRRVCMV